MNVLYAESLSWIRAHPEAMNTDVPPHLLDAWLHGELSGVEANFSLFGAGCLLWVARHGTSVGLELKSMDISRFYGLWQWKLAAAKISRATRVKVEPMRLFVPDIGSSTTCARLAPE